MGNDDLLKICYGAKQILKKVSSLANEQLKQASHGGERKGELQELQKLVGDLIRYLPEAYRKSRSGKTSVREWMDELEEQGYKAEDALTELAYEVHQQQNVDPVDSRKTKKRVLSIELFRKPNTNSGLSDIIKKLTEIKNKAKEDPKIDPAIKQLPCTTQDASSCVLKYSRVPRKLAKKGVDGKEPVMKEIDGKGPVVKEIDGEEPVMKEQAKVAEQERILEDESKLIEMLVEPAYVQIDDKREAPSIVPIGGSPCVGKTTLARQVFEDARVKSHFDVTMWVDVQPTWEAERILGEILQSLKRNIIELDDMDTVIALILNELDGRSFLLALDDVSHANSIGKRSSLSLKDWLLRLNSTRRNKILAICSDDQVASHLSSVSFYYTLENLSAEDCLSMLKGDINPEDREAIQQMSAGVPTNAKILGALCKIDPKISRLLKQMKTESLEFDDKLIPKLGFLHLSPSLQLCFAISTQLPRKELIEKDRLIQLWMALGLLQPQDNKREEDVGDEYVTTLLERSLFQEAKRDEYDNVTHIKLHSLAECLGECLKHTNPSRTIATKYLRVLILEKADITVEIPFGELQHLMYLDVSGTRIKKFHDSVAELYLLQTLRLMDCPYLEELPQELQKLVNLRHLCVDAGNKAMMKMPGCLGKLKDLQTLPFFNVVGESGGCGTDQLGLLKKLRGKLKLYNFQNTGNEEESKKARMKEKEHISELHFEGSSSVSDPSKEHEILKNLEPHSNLKSLIVHIYRGNKLPEWVSELSNLVNIKLSMCNECDELPTLGQLKFLKCLCVERFEKLSSIGAKFYVVQSDSDSERENLFFPALKRFSLLHLPKLERWQESGIAGAEHFPVLEELTIEGCPQLSKAPSLFPSLRKLHIIGVKTSMISSNISTQTSLNMSKVSDLDSLPEKMLKNNENLSTLTSPHVSKVSDLDSLPETMLKNNENLRSLHICLCPSLDSLAPRTWSGNNCLSSLSIYDCEKLKRLPEQLHNFTSLKELSIAYCNNLESIPSIDGLKSLRRLKIEGCGALEKLPSGLKACESLEHLIIKGCCALVSIPDEELEGLRALCSVRILGCAKLEKLPVRGLFHYLTRLEKLAIEMSRDKPQGLKIDYPELSGRALFKSLPPPIEGCEAAFPISIDPMLLETFASRPVGFLEALRLLKKGVRKDWLQSDGVEEVGDYIAN